MSIHIFQETYELVEVSGDGGRGGVACVWPEVGLHEPLHELVVVDRAVQVVVIPARQGRGHRETERTVSTRFVVIPREAARGHREKMGRVSFITI
jgi:hypothetical protein